MPVLKTAYDQEYLTSVFGRDHLNPMLVYDDQPLPLTPDKEDTKQDQAEVPATPEVETTTIETANTATFAKSKAIGKKVSCQMTSEAARVEIEDSETQGLAGREMEDASAPRVQINNLDRLVTEKLSNF